MTSLAEVHLVGDVNYLSHAIPPQMISLPDHLADEREAFEAPRLAPPEGISLEVRHDPDPEIRHRPGLELEGPVGLRLSDPAASEVRLQTREQRKVLLVQRKRERGANLHARAQLRPDGQRDAEASLALREAAHVPRVQRNWRFIGTLSCNEGRRIACRMSISRALARAAARLSFRISRYGVNEAQSLATSLGITRCLEDREGFPDMSRILVAPRGATGQVELTRQGISL